MQFPRIVITGEGIVCSIGLDKNQVLASLRAETCGIGCMRHLQSRHRHLPVGEVSLSNENMAQALGVDVSKCNRTALMGILSVKEALKDAGIADGADRCCLISGTTVGGMDITEREFPEMIASGVAHDCLSTHGCGPTTDVIADYFGWFTERCTISTACSSAANALILGAKLLATGQCDTVIAGGSEALSMFHLNGFNSLMILDTDVCRPFDSGRRGINLGEGAAFLVLETEEHAKQRGATIHAYLSGFGNACDAFHQTATSPDGRGAKKAMIEALSSAGLSPEQIDYINAHGTGTPDNDESESNAIMALFGNNYPPTSSTKSLTGHTTSASGAIESVISVLAIENGFIPGNYAWATPMPNAFMPNIKPRQCRVNHVMCNSFGFGGNDTSLIFSKEALALNIIIDTDAEINVLSEAEIVDDGQLADIKQWVKPMELRRMGKLMKASLLATHKAMEAAGIEVPDAIVSATSLGCLDSSEKFLNQMHEQGEQMMQPTHFMQSTHNTLGSQIAIRIGCQGYNVTYSHGEDSFKWAIRDAKLLLQSGAVKTVLVGCFDEVTPLYNKLTNGDLSGNHEVRAKVMILSCGS